MKTRVGLLSSLLRFDKPLNQILEPLAKFGWDSDQELVVLTRQQAADVLARYLKGELTASDVESWANALECRDDVGLEAGYQDLVREVVHELANPLLTRSLSAVTAKDWIQRLTTVPWNSG